LSQTKNWHIMLRRTGVTLLLVSLAVVNAFQYVDNAKLAAYQAIKGKGAVQQRVIQSDVESLVADVPEKEETKPETPTKDQGSTFSQAFRAIRSNILPSALSSVGQGLQLADQPIIEIPTDGRTVTLLYGPAATAVSITTQWSLENDAYFVYGKTSCSASACKKTAVKTPFDEALGTKSTTTFDYMTGAAKGDDYTANVGPSKDKNFNVLFGVATSGKKDIDVVTSDGYIGLGFKPVSGHAYGYITSMLAVAAPSRALTIWKKADLTSGIINLGDVTHKNCPKKKSELQDTVPDKDNVQRWWFKASKIEGDGKSVDKPLVRINLDEDTIGLPNVIVTQLVSKMKSNTIDDPSKLPKIKLTVGKDTIELDGSVYTKKTGDKVFTSILTSTDSFEYQVSLGNTILSKACLVLKQKDDTGKAFQVGLVYADSFSPSTTLSVFSLITLPLVYLMGL